MSFSVKRVTDEKELREVFKLRFKVYCLEWGFEKMEKFPDGLEKDEYDEHSVHFAAYDDSGKIMATIRLILGSPEGFPVEKYCQAGVDRNEIPENNIAEISRLAISREYRKRSEDKYIYGPDEERRSIGSFAQTNRSNFRRSEDNYRKNNYNNTRSRNESQSDRRSRHELVTSLYKAVYRESKKRQLTHWYAIMTKGLVILLKRFGIKFDAIGDPVDYNGIRTPYLGTIQKIEDDVSSSNPEILEEFAKDLKSK